jgi:hypothetical protein
LDSETKVVTSVPSQTPPKTKIKKREQKTREKEKREKKKLTFIYVYTERLSTQCNVPQEGTVHRTACSDKIPAEANNRDFA